MRRHTNQVLLLHNIISPHVDPVLRELAKLCKLSVFFCADSESNRSWRLTPKGYNYKILPFKKLELAGKDVFTFFLNPTLTREMSSLGPSLVILAGWDSPTYWLAALYCRLRSIPYIVWSGSTANEKSWRRNVSLFLVKIIVSNASGFIAYGQRAKEYLIDCGADDIRTTVAMNGFDLSFYKNYSISPKRAAKIKVEFDLVDKTVILFYGQLIERKDPALLLDAFTVLRQKYPNVSLLLIGSGPEKGSLKERVNELNLENVFIIPDPGDDAVRDYFALADIFVLPSREEVWGLVVNQAMAAGLPVVVSDAVGCIPDLVTDNKTGLVFRTGDVENLAVKLQLLLESKELRKKLGTEAKKRISLASPDKVARRIAQRIELTIRK